MTWKASAPRRATIRRLIAKGACAAALRKLRALPDSVRWDDRIGPLKAAVNRCYRR